MVKKPTEKKKASASNGAGKADEGRHHDFKMNILLSDNYYIYFYIYFFWKMIHKAFGQHILKNPLIIQSIIDKVPQYY